MLRLYIRCKAKMTSRDWEAAFLGMVINRFTFPDCVKSAIDSRSDQCSAEGSNEQSSEEEDMKEKQDLPIWKVLREFYSRERPRPVLTGHEGSQAPPMQQSPHHGYEESRVQGAPRRPFSHRAEGEEVYGPHQRPCRVRPHERLGPMKASKGPAGHHGWRSKPRPPNHEGMTPGAWTTPLDPDAEFSWLTERKVDVLGIQLVEELKIQPWPNPWQSRI